ncbi:MAG TPA: hypothetical protein PLG79_05235 [Spirochaetales bacterium]|nr:hypothetical protein [Spirochaetales bacterium]
MEYFDYTHLKDFLADSDIIETLNIDIPTEKLVSYYCTDEILRLDGSMRVPFFAEIRNYIGACEIAHPETKWIVKKIDTDSQRQTEIATICYFIDHLVRTPSAPTMITKIGGEFYKATKVINRSEQLSGANYTVVVELKEQLLLDLINRWIYCDEDRNPNNYMIKYNSRNNQIVIPIDFQNADLLFEGIKIEGTPKQFGWSRLEKTRYLTPLKTENFLIYDMTFFNMRFDYFRKLDMKTLEEIFCLVLRHNPDRNTIAKKITSNLAQRIDYVYNYFNGKFPLHRPHHEDEKYSSMGKAFTDIYNKFK